MIESLGETPMTGFHIWLCMFEGVDRDLGGKPCSCNCKFWVENPVPVIVIK